MNLTYRTMNNLTEELKNTEIENLKTKIENLKLEDFEQIKLHASYMIYKIKQKENNIQCVFCKKTITSGNNPQPYYNHTFEQCCDECDNKIVSPTRHFLIKSGISWTQL